MLFLGLIFRLDPVERVERDARLLAGVDYLLLAWRRRRYVGLEDAAPGLVLRVQPRNSSPPSRSQWVPRQACQPSVRTCKRSKPGEQALAVADIVPRLQRIGGNDLGRQLFGIGGARVVARDFATIIAKPLRGTPNAGCGAGGGEASK